MAGIFQKLRAWWNRDRVEIAQEEAGMTQAERDVAEEDFEARKDDVAARHDYLGGTAGTDFERDSEPPPRSG